MTDRLLIAGGTGNPLGVSPREAMTTTEVAAKDFATRKRPPRGPPATFHRRSLLQPAATFSSWSPRRVRHALAAASKYGVAS